MGIKGQKIERPNRPLPWDFNTHLLGFGPGCLFHAQEKEMTIT